MFILSAVFLGLTRPAYAYLDPGTGSYVFQLVIAGVLGSTFFLKSAISALIKKFKNSRQQNDTDKTV
jgi:hypothetical protein